MSVEFTSTQKSTLRGETKTAARIAKMFKFLTANIDKEPAKVSLGSY